MKAVFSIFVDNTSGVLSSVAGLFSRRGFNIDSLTVSETEDPAYSRMTIVSTGDDDVLDRIEKQLAKQVDVKSVKVLSPDDSVTRELILVKVAAGPADRQAVIATSDIFRAKIVDVSASSLTVELTGNQSKISAFINLLGEDRILELVRTGVTGLERGAGCMSDSIED